MAASGTHLTLYNLLTQSAEWCHPLPVADLAADPASQHFAVVLPPGAGGTGAGAPAPTAALVGEPSPATGGQGQQAQQGQQQEGAAGAVLVFCGAARAPVAGWALRRPAAPRAIFALPRTPLFSGAAQVSLLILATEAVPPFCVETGTASHFMKLLMALAVLLQPGMGSSARLLCPRAGNALAVSYSVHSSQFS